MKKRGLIAVTVVILISAIAYIAFFCYAGQALLNEAFHLTKDQQRKVINFYNTQGYCPTNEDIKDFPINGIKPVESISLETNAQKDICIIKATIYKEMPSAGGKHILLFIRAKQQQTISATDHWQCSSDAWWFSLPNNCSTTPLPH